MVLLLITDNNLFIIELVHIGTHTLNKIMKHSIT